MNPILFQQVPPLDTVSNKLVASIDACASSSDIQAAKKTLTTAVLPYLKSRFPDTKTGGKKPAIPATPQLLAGFSATTKTLAATLPLAQLFPLVDMWRLAVVDDAVAANWLAIPTNPNPDVLLLLLEKALEVLDVSDSAQKAAGRNYILTVLRLLSNGFAHTALARALLSRAAPVGKRTQVTRVVVATLLHEDAAVRTAAASLTFDVAAALQKSRVDRLRGGAALVAIEEDEEWEAELVSAVLEALSKEVQSEEVGVYCFSLSALLNEVLRGEYCVSVHRLVAALAFLLRLSPSYESQLAPLLEVLQSRETLEGKLQKGGCGEKGVQKPEVRKLIQEVAAKLCPTT